MTRSPQPLLFARRNVSLWSEIDGLAEVSRGLADADLKAAVEDGRLLLAHSVASGRTPSRVENDFLDALSDIRAQPVRYRRTGKTIRGSLLSVPY